MKCIIVKDYLNVGRNEFGVFYTYEDGIIKFLLDDCDVYTIKELREDGYEVIEIHSDDIVKAFLEKSAPKERK